MKRKNQTSKLLRFGTFDLQFDGITPHEYIEKMQDKKRLSANNIKIQNPTGKNRDVDALGPDTPFVLEAGDKGEIYAVGHVTQDAYADTHVYGHISIGYEFFVSFLLALTFIYLFLGVSGSGSLEIYPAYFLILCLVLCSHLFDAKRQLIKHLEEPQDNLIRPLKIKPRTENRYLDV